MEGYALAGCEYEEGMGWDEMEMIVLGMDKSVHKK